MRKGQHVRVHRRRYNKRMGSFSAGRRIGSRMYTPSTKAMGKSSVRHIESHARALMQTSEKIEAELGASGGHLANQMSVFEYRLYNKLQKMGYDIGAVSNKLPDLYYFIFEDANYHLLNKALVNMNAYQTHTPWSHDSEYIRYSKGGGRTWTL